MKNRVLFGLLVGSTSLCGLTAFAGGHLACVSEDSKVEIHATILGELGTPESKFKAIKVTLDGVDENLKSVSLQILGDVQKIGETNGGTTDVPNDPRGMALLLKTYKVKFAVVSLENESKNIILTNHFQCTVMNFRNSILLQTPSS